MNMAARFNPTPPTKTSGNSIGNSTTELASLETENADRLGVTAQNLSLGDADRSFALGFNRLPELEHGPQLASNPTRQLDLFMA